MVRTWDHTVPHVHNPNLWLSFTSLLGQNCSWLWEPDVSWKRRLELWTQCKWSISVVEWTRKVIHWWKVHGMKVCCFHLNWGPRLQVGVWGMWTLAWNLQGVQVFCFSVELCLSHILLFQPSVLLKQSYSSCVSEQPGPQVICQHQSPFTLSRTNAFLPFFPPSLFFFFPSLFTLLWSN